MTDYLYPTPFPREPVESSPGKFPSDLAAFGRWVLVIYGSELPSFVRDALNGFEGGFHLFEMSGAEPSPLEESVGVGASICRHERLDAILAVGGECAEDFACRVAERFRSQDPSGRGAGIVHLPI